ncbi:hypothetical protein ArV1_057 [Arthrobacter phage vB_ArtM-ArV1]|uniref:Uncharacterized protein n=1 Tax=Arthrobacter phage vB_ArtM-ArV1 TaxID=1566993 RepID=A0A0A7HE72_9CAUD|nr:hypothetical protein ArV1_057 [Arthrobacter phage vB_ArtM-ArV1]AIZ01745.1 hypothetical protein ArV1_057 [Arthrobacter phage vB_ArtM-ArV1]
MTIAPITQSEIDNVEVTREGDTLRAVNGVIKVTAWITDQPSVIRTRAVMLLALANYIDSPPLPPFEFPKNHAAVLLADTPMVDGAVGLARFTRIENSGWFSAGFGWLTEDTIRREFTNLRVVSWGVQGDPENQMPDETTE